MITHSQKVPWENLQFSRRPISEPAEGTRKPVTGFDTETLHGYAKILCDSAGNTLKIRKNDIKGVLDFLTKKRYRDSHNFFFNLKFDSFALVKHMPDENYHELVTTNETRIDDYEIYILPRKILSIKRKNRTYNYYDIAQFYETSLKKAAEKYLPIRKEPDFLDRKSIGSSAAYWDINYKPIVKYCIQDSLVCKELAQLVDDTIFNCSDMNVKKYMSVASVGKQYFRKNCDFWNLKNVPIGALTAAYFCYSGGWFEMFKKGHFEGEIVDSDINSAYPYAIKNFPDIESGTWERTKQYNDNALLGYYNVVVNIPPDTYIPPIPMRFKNGRIIHPTGEFRTGLTSQEINAYQDDVDIRVLYGWEYYTAKPTYPFRDEINKLYNLKNELSNRGEKDRFEYSLYKKLMNSFYGNTFQKNPIPEHKRGEKGNFPGNTHKAGVLFNPIMASFITASCRVQIWNAIKNKQDQIISIATDGIKSIGGLSLENSNKLGGWEVQKGKDFLSFQPGISVLDGHVKSRGMEKAKKIRTSAGTEYENIFEYIRLKPMLTDYEFELERPVGGLEVIQSKKYDRTDVNIFVSKPVTKNINTDTKRMWETDFRCGGEMLYRWIDSKPFHLGVE